MMNHRFSTTDTTMTEMYYILTEGSTQPLVSLGSIWNHLAASSDDRKSGRRSH